jgi:hypothetical protein
LQPDIVLIEGPPDADALIPLLDDAAMQPPVALLVYAGDTPQQAVYYPFAHFSPEYVAMRYALTHQITVRFMDLPQTHQFSPQARVAKLPETPAAPLDEQMPQEPTPTVIHRDPLGQLAEAAGYGDGERWWEHMVEQRYDGHELFTAILEAMTALRDAATDDPDPREPLREAWMRQTIRQAQKEGFQRIAVVCGAWHGPALTNLGNSAADALLLKKLPKTKVAATWVPWTYGRLAYQSGYGAGVESPGWYAHLFDCGEAGFDSREVATRWMALSARLLREQQIDASAAQTVDGVRLAEALAALRNRPIPGLPELSEASQAVFCYSDALPMQLIHEQLIVSERMGQVPEHTPQPPLQQDLTREQKRLKMPAEAKERRYDLDRRKATDLDRSRLLHRLRLLGINWGELVRIGGAKSTFKEEWKVLWQPELSISLIEAGIWGNTIVSAATSRAKDATVQANDLPTLTALVENTIAADLPEAIGMVVHRLQDQAALSNNVSELLAALPKLAHVARYSDVRKTDTEIVARLVRGMLTRACVGLPTACAGIDDDVARELNEQITAANTAIALLQDREQQQEWLIALQRTLDHHGCHDLIHGRCCRILLDQGAFTSEEVARRFGLALSPVQPAARAAAWIEGLLSGSGLLLIHDDTLWSIIDRWLMTLSEAQFTQTLPLVRRTFATFQAPERRTLGQRASGKQQQSQAFAVAIDEQRAAQMVPLVARLLGLALNPAQS